MSKSSNENDFKISQKGDFLTIKDYYHKAIYSKFGHLCIQSRCRNNSGSIENKMINHFEDVSVITISFCEISEFDFKNNNIKINLIECDFKFVTDKICDIIKIRNCKLDKYKDRFKNIKFNKLVLDECKISEKFLFFCQKFQNVIFKNCEITYGYNFKTNFFDKLSIYEENNNMIYHYFDDPDEKIGDSSEFEID